MIKEKVHDGYSDPPSGSFYYIPINHLKWRIEGKRKIVIDGWRSQYLFRTVSEKVSMQVFCETGGEEVRNKLNHVDGNNTGHRPGCANARAAREIVVKRLSLIWQQWPHPCRGGGSVAAAARPKRSHGKRWSEGSVWPCGERYESNGYWIQVSYFEDHQRVLTALSSGRKWSGSPLIQKVW